MRTVERVADSGGLRRVAQGVRTEREVHVQQQGGNVFRVLLAKQ